MYLKRQKQVFFSSNLFRDYLSISHAFSKREFSNWTSESLYGPATLFCILSNLKSLSNITETQLMNNIKKFNWIWIWLFSLCKFCTYAKFHTQVCLIQGHCLPGWYYHIPERVKWPWFWIFSNFIPIKLVCVRAPVRLNQRI